MIKMYVEVSRKDIIHARKHDERLFVVLRHPRDQYSRALCITAWEGHSHFWECTFENGIDPSWLDVDEGIASEVVNRTFIIKRMITEY